MMYSNLNHSVHWCSEQDYITLDNEFMEVNEFVRGIYGIFVETNEKKVCVYVGKSECLYDRMFGSKGHVTRLRYGKHSNLALNKAKLNQNNISIEVLEIVDCEYEDFALDMQKLDSRECHYIDLYQAKGQCLEQIPAGIRPEVKYRWEENKRKLK